MPSPHLRVLEGGEAIEIGDVSVVRTFIGLDGCKEAVTIEETSVGKLGLILGKLDLIDDTIGVVETELIVGLGNFIIEAVKSVRTELKLVITTI